jgi:ATP-dependent helicase HepA
MGPYQLGQRWISETEPELGLGLLVEVQGKTLKILFVQSQEERTYSAQNAPLKRVRFAVDEQIKLHDGKHITIAIVHERDGLLHYEDENGHCYPETQLSGELQFSKPEDRFLGGLIDRHSLFQLRIKTQEYKRALLSRSVRGLIGGKISLIPHQLYIASRVTSLSNPRVLLADQVGLGKTIEASLIIHRLLLTGQAQRVMILLPDSLVHQWFFELYRKFSLSFKMINQETSLEKGENPFVDNERVIVSMGLLKGAPMAREMLERASFDLLVVDEAHALKSKDEELNFEFQMVQTLAARTPGLVMLTATPEQFGQEDHFRRLRLLDPHKYKDFETYKQEKERYGLIAGAVRELGSHKGEEPLASTSALDQYFTPEEREKLTVQEGILALADRYGTGRSYFRNIRKGLDQEFLFFPKRFLHATGLALPAKAKMADPLEDHETGKSFEAKSAWLVEALQTLFTDQKVLLICKSKKKILKLEEFLRKSLTDIKTASFHSDLSLMARDRQAAYFADPKGAQVLLCTEVGSEGRNFEFCQQLVLFDLPLHPHPLEQRIGRLDRIGQKRDIHIYLPYIENTWEEVLYRWYHEGLDLFEKTTESSQEVFELMKTQLQKVMMSQKLEGLKELVNETKQSVADVEKKLQEGRDLLVEKNSFDPFRGRELVREITKLDTSDELQDYLDHVFDCFGVDTEDVQGSTWYVRPSDNMFVPAFPHLDSDGKTFTFSRTKALEREDFDFLTWDHPLVTGAMDLIISQNFGTNCVVVRGQSGSNSGMYLEGYYVFECPAPLRLGLERFGASQLVRVLIDDQGRDLSEKFHADLIDSKVQEASHEVLEMMKKFPKDKLMSFKKRMDKLSEQRLEALKIEALELCRKSYEAEMRRAEELLRYQPEGAEQELVMLKKLLDESIEAINKATLRFDAFRCVL